jgi:hypothetical protein
LLIIGPIDQAEKAAALVSDVLQVVIFAQGWPSCCVELAGRAVGPYGGNGRLA